jgi:hypothetical protein
VIYEKEQKDLCSFPKGRKDSLDVDSKFGNLHGIWGRIGAIRFAEGGTLVNDKIIKKNIGSYSLKNISPPRF